MKRIIILIFCLIIISAKTVFPVSQVAAYLDNSPNAKAIAMGSAQVAYALDGYAVYWNPACLGELKKHQIYGTSTKFFNIIQQNQMGIAYKFSPDFGISVSYLNLGLGNIPEASSTGELTGNSFSYSANALLVGAGFSFGFIDSVLSTNIFKNVYAGATIKMLNEKLHENSAEGAGIDIGGKINISENFSIGGRLENLIRPKLSWDTESKTQEALARRATAGFCFKPLTNVSIVTDLVRKEKEKFKCYIGIEGYVIKSSLLDFALRAGRHDENTTLGLGLKISSIQFDYAYEYTKESYIENSHWITISYNF